MLGYVLGVDVQVLAAERCTDSLCAREKRPRLPQARSPDGPSWLQWTHHRAQLSWAAAVVVHLGKRV